MKTKLPILLTLAGILFINGCTNLNEVILDETSATGLSDKQAADGIIAPEYARLPDIFLHTNYFTAQEISTDEAILPYRGGTDWGDNGIYIAMHQHTHTSTDPNLGSTWGFILQGLSRSITAMNLDLLYRERGFELYWEMVRRTDMIRFGKYEGTWTEKTNTDRLKRIFPIPQTAIDGASNLPGYLKQNDSY